MNSVMPTLEKRGCGMAGLVVGCRIICVCWQRVRIIAWPTFSSQAEFTYLSLAVRMTTFSILRVECGPQSVRCRECIAC